MKVNDKEILVLTQQINAWSVEIAVLSAKYQAAAGTAQKFAQDLADLRTLHYAATQQMRDLELHKSGMYMWENIGDGG